MPIVAEVDFFRAGAKQSTESSIRRVESQTSAEVVVAVKRRSGDYRPDAYHFASLLGGLVVAYLLLSPELFSVGAIVLDGVLGFGLGLVLAYNIGPLLRLVARSKKLEQSVAEAARVAFFDLGISRTARRNGLLVYVSTFEQRCVVLTDIGIDVAALGVAWAEQCAALTLAVKRRDLAAFERALEGLGPILGAAMPRSDDDVNELRDEVH